MAVNTGRFVLVLPPDRRAALDSLASEVGLSTSALVRLAINRLLRERDVLLAAKKNPPKL
jgi:hypothetical protein